MTELLLIIYFFAPITGVEDFNTCREYKGGVLVSSWEDGFEYDFCIKQGKMSDGSVHNPERIVGFYSQKIENLFN